MTLHPRLSRASIELVKQFEGFRRVAARLDNGVWTIGYGHTRSAREGAVVSEAEAEALLLYDLDKACRLVEGQTFTPLNDNQFSALVAFAFSVGPEAFRSSTVLARINEGGYLQAAAAIELWRRSELHGQPLVIDALVRRRAAEKLLFLTPPEGFRPVPSAVVPPLFDAQAGELNNLSAGLAGAAVLRVPLDGPSARIERVPDVPAATLAAENLGARMQALLAESADDEPPPFPVQTGAEAEPPSAEAPLNGPASEPAPPREPAPAEPPPPPMASPEMMSPPAGAFGRRPVSFDPLIPAGHAFDAAGRWPALREPAILVAGAVGLVLFVVALLATAFGRSTLINLVLGLVGVVLMAPAGQRLAVRLLGRNAD